LSINYGWIPLDGSIADAIRNERRTGQPTREKFHSKKGKDAIKALRNWLRGKSKPKSDSDKKIAREIIEDLKDALGESDHAD
jgi:hypothetical protein